MSRTRSTVGTCGVLAALVLGTSLATIPTPLYPVYTVALGLDSLGVTATFAAFAGGAVVGLGASILLAGRFSRLHAFMAACVLQVVAAILLGSDLGLAGFVAGRIVTGLGAGLLAASGTALVFELAADLRGRGAVILRVTAPGFTYVGLGLGPLLGALAGPQDLAGVHALFLGVGSCLTALLVASLLLPRGEPVGQSVGAVRLRLPKRAGLGAFAAFMTTGLFGSATSTILQGMGVTSTLVTGSLAALVFFAGAVGVAVFASRVPLRAAALLLAIALIGVAAGASSGSLTAVVVAGTVAGAASGALFSNSLTAAVRAMPSAPLAQTALVFLCAYLGLSVPVLGLGLAMLRVGTEAALWVFVAFAGLTCVVVASPRRWTDQNGGFVNRE